jgi:putative salt-induced outer membrane protein YdiY
VQYGLQALKTEGASVAVAFDTGYRLQGYAEEGIAGTGPVLRGNVEWRQSLGERARLSQTTRVETGQHGTFLRNSLLLRFQLQPALSLDTGVETRRDSEVRGRNQTDAKLNLRYVF